MNYEKIYHNILERGMKRIKRRGDFLHRHRILPFFMGGTYENSNITYLTRKEHRLVHKLRWKLYKYPQDNVASGRLQSKVSDTDVNLKIYESGQRSGKIHKESGHCARIAHMGGSSHKNSSYVFNPNTGEVKRLQVGKEYFGYIWKYKD